MDRNGFEQICCNQNGRRDEERASARENGAAVTASIHIGDRVWLVTNPRPTSELADFVSEITLGSFMNWCVGGGAQAAAVEQPALHLTRDAALEDAAERVRKAGTTFAAMFAHIAAQIRS